MKPGTFKLMTYDRTCQTYKKRFTEQLPAAIIFAIHSIVDLCQCSEKASALVGAGDLCSDSKLFVQGLKTSPMFQFIVTITDINSYIGEKVYAKYRS